MFQTSLTDSAAGIPEASQQQWTFNSSSITGRQMEMGPVRLMMWINIGVCLPLTILVICCVCCVVRRDQVPVIYYTNLLISNLIQMCTIIIIVAKPDDHETYMMSFVIYYFGVLASLYFKMCIALERCFFITRPLLDCMRQTRGSMLVCILVWALCVISVPVAAVLRHFLRVFIFILIPVFLFVSCFAATLNALNVASSVPTKEKRRIVATLILLLLNYFLMILPAIIELTFEFHPYYIVRDIVFILFLLSPFMDLILFLFMRKGPTDKLLACLCCCNMDNTAAGHQCD
ncbi:mas-related G-protein coupled receptor member X1-like isoform X1 [Archocentrus centrarchus]|uniref:mas-related G-protein coupled receptor member X1-like isoform X1 n=2 Tax=Archocentrus centrarchus TaxID=63155 RepID=UPI0011EA36EF|nr:mas-related G-protein coupled receptor member X1-like isoform X1 [Archocentrus centrarchus]